MILLSKLVKLELFDGNKKSKILSVIFQWFKCFCGGLLGLWFLSSHKSSFV